jgi:hypothetical protein
VAHAAPISARFRPRTRWEAGHRPDSPALHPLHSNRSSPAFRHKIHWLHAWLPLIRSDGRKLARQSGTNRARPKRWQVRHAQAARLRPARSNSPRVVARGQGISNTARGSACRRGQAIGPQGFATAKTSAINREIGHFRTASISQATLRRTEMTGLTHKSNLV